MSKINKNITDPINHPEVELVGNSITLSQANNPKAHLSATQKRFNTLSKQINRQKELFADLPKKEALVRDYYNTNILPIHLKEMELMVTNIQLMDQRLGEWKFTKKRKAKVIDEILRSCDIIMLELDEDTEMYKICKDLEAKHKDEADERLEIEMAADMFQMMFNMDVGELADEATSLADFMEKVKSKMEEKQKEKEDKQKEANEDGEENDFFNAEFEAEFEAEQERQRENGPKLTVKQQLKADQEQKSLRAIYIELVRQLHPDTAVDQAEKDEKEARMKDLTTAYRDKDLYTLLSMQLQWMSESKVPLAQQTDEVLAKYNTLMNKQLKSLKREYEALRYHSIAGVTRNLAGLHFESEKVIYKDLASEQWNIELSLHNQIKLADALANKKTFFEHVDYFFEDEEEEDDYFDFF